MFITALSVISTISALLPFVLSQYSSFPVSQPYTSLLQPYSSSYPNLQTPSTYPSPQGPSLSPYSNSECLDSEPILSPVCGPYAQNCTVILESQYTIQYKEECGRRYQKVCPGDAGSCRAVVDPGCYQVPTHTPVEVPREVCYSPQGHKCDKYPRRQCN